MNALVENALIKPLNEHDFSRAFQSVKKAEFSRAIDTRIDGMRLPTSLSTARRFVDANKPIPEVLFDVASSFKLFTSQVSMHLGREWRNRLFKQLDGLLDSEQWETGDAPPTLQSYSTMLRMLLKLKPPRKPGLGLTSDGQFVAAWTNGVNRLTIHCMPRDQLIWILTRHFDGVSEKAAGNTDIHRLAVVLAPYEPNIWFDHAE